MAAPQARLPRQERATGRSNPSSAARSAPELRVVTVEDRVRTVGAMGTIFVAIMLATLFAIAALHAVVVNTQARIDGINEEISTLEDELEVRVADEAWLDSPAGVHEAAQRAGLVEAADVVALAPVPEGQLAPPGDDPFGPGSDG